MKCIYVLSILLIVFKSNAQDKKLFFNYITTQDGLSSNRIRCIFKDSKGYLWIGSELGLDKYNGYDFVTYSYNEQKSGSLSNNDIWDIFEDSKNNLWIATADGLNLYDPDKDNFILFKPDPKDENSLDDKRVVNVFEDSGGTIWVNTRGNCLNKWIPEQNKFIRYQLKNSQGYTDMVEDANGNIWVVSVSSELNLFNPKTGKFSSIKDSSVNMGDGTKYLYLNKEDNTLWISSKKTGLYSYDLKTKLFKHYNTNGDGFGTNGNILYGMAEEDKDNLLISVHEKGLNRYNKRNKTFEYIGVNSEVHGMLNANQIWCLHKDREGFIWLGTVGGGINYYNPYKKKFNLFRHDQYNTNTLTSNLVNCINEGANGEIWIGTDGSGISVYNPNTGNFKTYKNEPDNPSSLYGNIIGTIKKDKNGDMWLSGWKAGLNRFDAATGKFYNKMPDGTPTGLSGPTVWDFTIAHDGLLWLGVFEKGIDVFDPEKGVIKRFRHPNEVSGDRVQFVFEDSDNNIWVGTNDGLDKYDKKAGSFVIYKNLPSKIVSGITEDNNRNLWLATDNGLCLISPEGKVLEEYNESNGLASNIVHGVVKGNDGNIWVSTNKGISVLDIKKKTIKNFTQKEGLQDNVFRYKAIYEAKNGVIYAGGFNGLNSFNPTDIVNNPIIPPVHITEFKLFNRDVEYGVDGSPLQVPISSTKEIILTHMQSVFSFGFIAINYTNPEKNKYAYIMEGFEKEWNYTDASRRYATYTNLPAGEYIFKVKASNNDGIWNEEGSSIKIVILPPWWKTTWFVSLVIILAILIVSTIIYLRNRQVRMQKKILEDKVKEATEGIKQRNEHLNAAKEKLSGIMDEVRNQLGKASEELMDATNSQAATIEEISVSIEQMALEIDQNAKGAKEISNKAQFVRNETVSSVKTVEEAVGAIKTISEKITFISDIAKQTKFLSLNASIEAARAGIHGRSFAIVAKEVKSLSDYSQQTADDIIGLSTSGMVLSNQASQKINDLLGFVHTIVSLIDKITESSINQSSEAEKINAAVQEISSYITQTAQLAQELDFAINSLAVKDDEIL